MAELTPEERKNLLHGLVETLERWHLRGVAHVFARTGRGAGVIASQLLLLAQPLTPHTGWRTRLGGYAQALEDDQGWKELIELLERPQS